MADLSGRGDRTLAMGERVGAGGDSIGDPASVLVASFDDGRIVGLDARTGAVRWIVPRLATAADGSPDHRWLTGSAGVVVATSLQPNLIAGYDAGTGAQLWSVLSDQGSILDETLTNDGELAYLPFNTGDVGAYELATGKRRWLRSAPVGLFADPPVISHDTLFLGGWDAAYAIRR